jgi:uncharacterized protein (TIGR04255 family)
VKYRREQLRKAPLVEAVFEVRATCRTEASLIPGAVYGRLKERYVHAETNAALVVTASDAAQVGQMHRFLTRDRKQLIQSAPELFTVNVLGDYGAFPEFARLINEALTAFYAEAQPMKIKRLGIRYINFISSDEIVAAGGTPLKICASFPTDVLPSPDTTALRGAFKFPRDNGVLGLAISNPHQLADERRGCLLDLDFFVENPPFLAVEECLPWARQAHDVIYQVFRSVLTDQMYKQLEPIPDGKSK